jgi:hypothetical protein
MRYLVTANVKITSQFEPYKPGDKIATVGYFYVEAESFGAAADAMWVVGNKEGADADGERYPADVRSLSVGDVLFIADDGGMPGSGKDQADVQILAVARWGWTEIGLPRDGQFVPLAGTDATSRTA